KQFVIVFGAGAVTAATEADKVALDKDILSIELAQVSGASATYPLVGAYGSTITWDVSAVTGATYVAETGAMTYPVVTADADYNVVATITNGTTSDTVTFVVHVRAVTDQEKLAEDQAALTLAATANEYDTIVLPATGGNGSAITWVVNTGSATLDGANLFMNLVGSAYDVTLTATLNLGTETALTKDFTIAVSPITIVTDLSTFAAGTTDGTTITWTIPNDTYVYVKGIVVGIAYDGAFIQDANGNGLLLYKLKTGLAIGDEVVVYGKLAAYRSARELANGCVLKTVVSSENTVTSATVTLDQLVAFTFADAGKNITVSGLTIDHFDGSVVYLKAQGTSSSMLLKMYFNNFATWLDEVYTAGDALPEVTFVFYNIPDAATFNIDLFQIQVNESQLLGVALGSLVIPTAITEATTLTLPATFGDVALSYASNNEAVINPTTGVVDLTGLTTQVTVTLTVTATYGTSTDSATFTIKVGEYPLVDIATAISGANGDIIRTKGIITQVSGNNFWIQDTTGALYVYLGTTATFASNVVVGNEVEVIGTFKIYSTLNEVSPVESVTLVSEGNTLPTLVDVVGSDLATLTANINKLVNVSGLIIKSIPTVETNSYTIYLTDGVNDVQLRVDKYGAEFAAINTVVAGLSVGQAVTLSGIAVGVYNNTPQLAWYEAAELATATLTDQEIADIEVLLVTMPSATVSADFTLDVAGLNSATTITWASDSAAIAITGDAATVTQPASGEADATVVLTFTVTFGTATASDTFTVTVPAQLPSGTETLAYSTGFEDVTKGSYTLGDVTSNSVVWSFDNALIGTTASTDKMIELHSARIKALGSIYTGSGFTGVSKIVFNYADYGTYTTGAIDVMISLDGVTWVTILANLDPEQTMLEYTLTIDYNNADVIAAGITDTSTIRIKFYDSGAERVIIDNVSVYTVE
ncbi:MAG: hypothetical protein PHP32_00270, partial [Candidatus Izemoplasmatales bacterium]|nr:hypothetical protein [Candidatus Izemoplasmatales bacterium]